MPRLVARAKGVQCCYNSTTGISTIRSFFSARRDTTEDGQIELIKLSIAWTLVGAFIFTVIITCLSLFGWIKFTDRKQQDKLFYVLIVQLVTIAIGSFTNLLNLSPSIAGAEIRAPLEQKVDLLKDTVSIQKAQNEQLIGKLEISALDGLQPEAVVAATRLIDAAMAKGITLRVVGGYRSPDQQAELYAQGRSKPGPIVTNARVSVHSTGLAFDVVPEVNGHLDWSTSNWQEISQLGKSLGLVWGGDGTMRDLPHFETPDAQEALTQLKKRFAPTGPQD